ncbi:MAG: hypothetical protein ABS75_29870 [Pelagibacterium sp. SCN 63-23]|nr:MAG: hypothetical protein ABS75_29870 [Pelagibacterium sp. SCN 63-23]
MSEGEPRNEEVAEALQHVLSWPAIARSGQLAKFLDYIVQRKLEGRAHSIKAYSIAVDVFGRQADFDPQSDPIVRVQARRLRGLLSQFYRENGACEKVRITLPTGRYVPEFVRVPDGAMAGSGTAEPEPVPPVAVPSRRPGSLAAAWLLLAVVTICLTILALAFSDRGPPDAEAAQSTGLVEPPSVLVTDFQSLTGDIADIGMGAGLAIELMNDLSQFGMISARYGGGSAETEGNDFVLSGIVRRQAGGLQYSAILTEVASGAVVWSQAIGLSGGEVQRVDLLSHVSDRLSAMLGSPRGPLHQRARALLAEDRSISGGENLYLCRVLFDLYREQGSMAVAGRTQACLAALGAGERESGEALAAGASLLAETGDEADMNARLAEAEARLALALQRAPVSAFVWEQRGRFLELAGRHEQAEAAYGTAVQINPANTDAIAARARHLALMGRQASAEALAAGLIADSPNPPAWYYGVPALQALRTGDFQQAVDYAGIYAEADRELGPVLAVMAGQGLRDADIVNRYLPRVLDHSSFRARGVLTQLRQRISDEALLRDIRIALLSAGVPSAALNQAF